MSTRSFDISSVLQRVTLRLAVCLCMGISACANTGGASADPHGAVGPAVMRLSPELVSTLRAQGAEALRAARLKHATNVNAETTSLREP